MTEYAIYESPLGVYLLKPDLISDQLGVGNFWEPELRPIFDQLTSEMVVIEVGSYIGDHTIYLSKRCKQVYAIECNTRNYYQLCANLLLNNCTNVDAHNKCVGYSNTRAKLSFIKEGNNAGAVYIKDSSGNIPIYTLDKLFLKYIDRLDYIVTDVEGMDLDVLLGAMGLIDKFKPLIIFEFNEKHSPQSFEEYTKYLTNLNYSIKQLGTWNWLAEYKGI